MTATITKEIKTYFITNTIGYNLVALLINRPTLGITNSPTNDQLLLRENLTMATAVDQEVSSTGYQRYIATVDSEDIVYSNGQATVNVTATFTAPTNSSIGPFTHIVWTRGANLIGATSANGNNRGNTNGTIWKVELVNQVANTEQALTLQAGATYSATTDITITV